MLRVRAAASSIASGSPSSRVDDLRDQRVGFAAARQLRAGGERALDEEL